MRTRFGLAAAATALALLGAAAPALRAQSYHVNMDLGSLSGLATTGAPYYFEFTLTNGSGVPDGNASAHVGNFSLTGGAIGAVLPPTIGDATGDLQAGALTLVDDAGPTGTADYAQAFSIQSAAPAKALSFDLTLTALGGDAPTPDAFLFEILDNTQTPIPTNGPGGVEFVRADYNGPVVLANGYSSTSPALAAVVTAAVPGAVPEPGVLAMLCGAAAPGILLFGRRRRS